MRCGLSEAFYLQFFSFAERYAIERREKSAGRKTRDPGPLQEQFCSLRNHRFRRYRHGHGHRHHCHNHKPTC